MKIFVFGIVKDIFKNSMINMDLKNDATIEELKISIEEKYPRLKQLGSYMIAVNNEYASDNDVIHLDDEVAIIPPVSGG